MPKETGNEVFVEAVAADGSCIVLAGGEVVAITGWYDDEGEDCDDWSDARTIVAGPLKGGGWLTVDLSFFAPGFTALH
jgi:hypothetical protein